MVVLIDANVVLDYITSREPYYRESYKIIDLLERLKDILHFILFLLFGIP